MKGTLQQQQARLGVRLISPAVIIIGLLIIYPVFYNLYLSFHSVKLSGESRFVGLSNYAAVIGDAEFWRAFLSTALYVFFTTVGTTLFGLIVALAMNKEFPGQGLVRSLLLLPYIAPVISVVFAWQFFFDPVNGIFMHLMVDQWGLYAERFNLIRSPRYALWVAIIFSIWKNFPFTYLMILSRLQAIDQNLYEAAEIDGCTGIKKFFYITLPEIYFVLGSIVLMRIIWNMNKFEDIFLLTDNVKTLPVYTYFKAFTGALDMGQGSAISIIQFAILIGFIILYVKKVLKW
jgi:multiple sugar transport system permease protein